MSTLPTISPAGFSACMLWYAQAMGDKSPDPSVLTRGFGGRLDEGRVTEGGKIAVTLIDQRTGKPRNERFFDAPDLFCLRMVLAPKISIRFDHSKTTDPQLHYLTIGKDQLIQRIIGGAHRGEEIHFRGDFHDYSRGNLKRRKAGVPHKGRNEAIEFAMTNFEKLVETHWLRQALSAEDYRGLLKTAFRLADDMLGAVGG